MQYLLNATGSSGSEYDVVVDIDNNEISIFCDCKAASLQTMCRHRAALLAKKGGAHEEIFAITPAFTAAYSEIQKSPLINEYADHLARLDAIKKQLKQLEQVEKNAFLALLEGRK